MSVFATKKDDFRSSLESIVSPLVHKTKREEKDSERDYLKIPAANIIEFVHSPQYLNIPSIFEHVRQYQILRDFFQCRCPICNPLTPEAVDCWDKGREYLESEALLVWSDKYQDDVCPKCDTTRRELLEDEAIHKYNQLHGIVGMRSSCYNWGMITTNLGLMSAKEILASNNIIPQKDQKVNQSFKVNFNVVGENKIEPASHIIYEGIKPSKILGTKGGFKTEVSPIHPMRILKSDLTREWVESKDMNINNYLMIRIGADVWGSKNTNKYKAKLLGYLVACGGYGESDSISYTKSNIEMMNNSINCLSKGFNINVNISKDKRNGVLRWQCSQKHFVKELRELGLDPIYSKTKEVPLSIRQSTKDTVREFLRAYLTSDGWCSILSSGRGYKKPQVGYDTVSEKLARQVQYLLLNFGIVTSLSKTKSRKFGTNEKFDHDVYMVRINSEYLHLFTKEIGFLDSEKKEALKECLELVKNTKRKPNFNNINGAGNVLRQYLKDINVGEGCRLDSKGNVYQNAITTNIIDNYDSVRACWKRKIKSVSREIIKKVVDDTKEYGKKHSPKLLKRFEDFINEDWLYVPITSIEDGECEMADLHVPGSHSFVANGFLNHNSGKTATVALIGAYLEHKLIGMYLKEKDYRLSSYFGVLPKQPFEVTY
ncbi:hypothetical protein LCGC14_1882580, partial [marine sediment metagenome]